jgi:hypothetical protein
VSYIPVDDVIVAVGVSQLFNARSASIAAHGLGYSVNFSAAFGLTQGLFASLPVGSLSAALGF